MALTTNVLSATAKSINRLFEDKNLTSTITYKLFQGSSFSDSLGYAQEVYINYFLSAIRTERKRFSLPSPGEPAVYLASNSTIWFKSFLKVTATGI